MISKPHWNHIPLKNFNSRIIVIILYENGCHRYQHEKERMVMKLRCIYIYGCQPKNRGILPPNHRPFNRVFHYFHHPFWGFSPYFWVDTHIYIYIWPIIKSKVMVIPLEELLLDDNALGDAGLRCLETSVMARYITFRVSQVQFLVKFPKYTHRIWAIYNDLSRGHPKWWFSKGMPPKMALN